MIRALCRRASGVAPLFAICSILALTACASGAKDGDPTVAPGGDGSITDSTLPGDDGATSETPTDDAPSSDAPPSDAPGSETTPPSDTGTSSETTPPETGDACPTACSVGVKICEGNAVRTCGTVGACIDFSAAEPCPGGTVCSGGACVTSCTDVCTLGSNQCSGSSGVQTCEKKASGCTDWSAPTACDAAKVCSGGACVTSCTDACTPSATRCAAGSSDATQKCEKQASGCYDWSSPVACGGGGACSGGSCVACTSGAKRCGATGNVEQCTAGAWSALTTCSFGCVSGACSTSVTCTPGAYRCAGSAVEICNSSGTAYLYSATCAVSCSAGLCTGACTPGAKRCNALNVETCNAAGTAWTVSDTCASFCDAPTSTCAMPTLTIDPTTTKSFDGEIVVAGALVVKAGSTMSSSTGNLTIRAQSITVELGGSITAAPTGATADGKGSDGYYVARYCDGSSYYSSGYHGAAGGSYSFGSSTDAQVLPGSMGGNAPYGSPAASGGHGGGVIRLIAANISIAGQVTANGENGGAGTSYGGGGGGSGGGILIAADSLTVSGTITASGGAGGGGGACNGTSGGGGLGRVKLLYGTKNAVTGTITGQKTQGILPPLQITSSTHPDSTLIYNDDFPTLAFTWNQPFTGAKYYQLIDTSASNVPTPATGGFVSSELSSCLRSKVVSGTNYFHIVSMDATSTLSTVENTFKLQINTTPPSVTSPSHPSPTTWSSTVDAYFKWTTPNDDKNYTGFYYVLDHYGTTVPTSSDTFLPITQKQLLRSGLESGVWAFHVVSVDQKGYLTKLAGLYRVRVGGDPGTGSITGNVVDGTSAPVTGATITINKGLFNPEAPDQASNSAGSYSFPAVVPAGTWEVTASKTGFAPKTQLIVVNKGATASANFTLTP